MFLAIRSTVLSSLHYSPLHFTFTRTMGSMVSCKKKGLNNTSRCSSSISNSNNMSGDIVHDKIEEIVCSESEIPEGGIKSVELQGTKILIAKVNGILHAVGSKCTHYGLPLEKGSICNGRIRCPFHGACFSLETGDIEDFPGLDSLPKYEVNIDNGEVKVGARKSQLEVKKRVKGMTKKDPNNNETFIVVGGGAAGAKCVETLRQEGFSGNVVLLTAEKALPYDRPKLSKAMHLGSEAMALRTDLFYQEANITVKLGALVTEVNTCSKHLKTSCGDTLHYDKLFLATGGQPRPLSVPGSDLKNIFVLRDPNDANAIVEKSKGRNVIVIGTSFIGMETAAYLASEDRSSSVTVVGSSSTPFERVLGTAVGERIQRMFEEKGVKFINGAKVTKIEGVESVEKVIINGDKEVPAEVVVAGIGVIPSTSFLRDSQVALDDRGYVPVNEEMRTNVEDVYCGGDIASFPLFLHPDSPVSIGHWQMAHAHGHTAALNMLNKKKSIASVPFFWTVLFGKSLRYTGYGTFDDVIITGNLEELNFIAYYCKGGRVVSLASLGRDPAAANYANYLFKGSFLTKEEVVANEEIAMELKC